MSQSPAIAPRRGLLPVIGWACFLGSSWTWVIGMLFPVLLLRDYGVWGWVVFAVPNVIGAVAMAFVLGSTGKSRRVFDDHLPMIVRFSEVTLAFHFFVVVWLLGQWSIALGLVPVAVGAAGAWAASVKDRHALAMSAIVTLASLGLFVVFLMREGFWLFDAPASDAVVPSGTMFDLLCFAPAAVAGFVLCPYLDATFHRARQATTPATGRLAFVLGFGVVFLAMIVYSLAYAPGLVAWFSLGSEGAVTAPILSTAWIILVGGHIALQTAFTTGLHLREANDDPAVYRFSPRLLVPMGLGAILGWVARAAPADLVGLVPMSLGEMIYRCFLLLYGLVFPAYVFLCMLPTPHFVPDRRRATAFLLATLAALPFAFAGFVLGESWCIPVSLAILVAGWVVMATRRRAA